MNCQKNINLVLFSGTNRTWKILLSCGSLTRNLACRCLPPTLTITSEDIEVASLGVPGVPGPPEDDPPAEAEIMADMAGSEAEEESPVQTICDQV